MTPTPPLCTRCGQPFPLIHLSVYPHGLFCPTCDRARATVPSDIVAYPDATGFTVSDLEAQAAADVAAMAEGEGER